MTGKASRAILTHGKAHDVVSVSIGVIGDILGSVVDLTTTEELLLLGRASVIQDNTESSSHVDDLALTVEMAVLTGVSATVAKDVVKSVSLIRLVERDRVVVVGLGNLTDPRAN